jgi:hypothetical protein
VGQPKEKATNIFELRVQRVNATSDALTRRIPSSSLNASSPGWKNFAHERRQRLTDIFNAGLQVQKDK